MRELVHNALVLDADSVWVRPDAKPFGYTDGLRTERYLEQVLTSASDLSSDSLELESKIVDWPTEYHLSTARANLLRGFEFDRSLRVVEVGCGCGAITRFLGETFDQVVSVEGNHARARLARIRTRDQDNVSIVQSPFEELRFKNKFDIVFCIGVFEYSARFVRALDPYERVLEYFSELVSPGGVVVLAIENQLGLKYFSSSAEDHTGVMFDGIEGYPRVVDGARTFGYPELKQRLEKHFPRVRFFFPLPDYKTPSSVISEQMLSEVDISDFIGSFRSVDHAARGRRPLFCEPLAWAEIARNGMVPWFANSFLAVAGDGRESAMSADWLGVAFSRGRRKEFSTVTRFLSAGDGPARVVKSRTAGGDQWSDGNLIHREWSGPWIHGPSLQFLSTRLARTRGSSLEQVLEPSRAWYEDLRKSSREDNGIRWVDGDRIDSIWRNCFVLHDRCVFIDQEWVWHERLPLTLVVSRGLYYFAQSLLGSTGLGPALQGKKISRFLTEAARVYGLTLTPGDLDELARFEGAFLDKLSGRRRARSGSWGRLDVHLVLRRRLARDRARRTRPLIRRILHRVRRVLSSV